MREKGLGHGLKIRSWAWNPQKGFLGFRVYGLSGLFKELPTLTLCVCACIVGGIKEGAALLLELGLFGMP